ncbi:thiamine pyrophosphate-binding protein [Ancylobacter amanitiformis]|uniref:2-succinyl-5-enolpyruvyl-6-hydroxy-3-cyclohexene-1-carboxylate synthase n=1 Tax=Ancylobacter amanitiformis TaxID=217069 RepID=A0ABU0LRW0_9HYPH|nr:thiamine pyrophosphate-binding protein [Ancylobacter amanitiformis]MDQ0511446.1 2-succinyl-5-enolpyruvyl-6-hydroxy-3-cyclohexene-1-carboxylate synthase [Ancylobacter amanitiformis]
MRHYTTEKNVQVIIYLLKNSGIRHVIASPGATNIAFVASIQSDPFFTIYSCVDERSAAYMACGLAAELGEPVVLSCTGATASRNYGPGLTEAYYRKLPVLAITSTQIQAKVGHHVAQVIDRSSIPNDIAKLSVQLPVVKDADDLWDCEMKVNQAILALKRHGGGPVHINLPTTYSRSYDVKTLPACRVIDRITPADVFPPLSGKVAVFVGAHATWSPAEADALERFCAANNAVVLCDHTSGYRGTHGIHFALAAGQDSFDPAETAADIMIHIGEISGDYDTLKASGKQVWRVNPDGEIRDTFRKLRYVFEMPEISFFAHYAETGSATENSYLATCREKLQQVRANLPELPFSNAWLASRMAHRLPESATIHFGILNSLRTWNYFDLPPHVTSACNVGGFGIDGCLSALVGASLANKDKLYFLVTGDLAFFYDMNALGNRHVGPNIRILLVNNGKGTEFTQYAHPGSALGDDANVFVAASGHFGTQSRSLVKNYAQNLGFDYLSAESKEGFEAVHERFLSPGASAKPLLFEVFTDGDLESDALKAIKNIDKRPTADAVKHGVKQLAKDMLGTDGVNMVKKLMGR